MNTIAGKWHWHCWIRCVKSHPEWQQQILKFSHSYPDRHPMQRIGQAQWSSLRNGNPLASHWIPAHHSTVGHSACRRQSNAKHQTSCAHQTRRTHAFVVARWRRQINLWQEILQIQYLRVPLHRSDCVDQKASRRFVHRVRLLQSIIAECIERWYHTTIANEGCAGGRQAFDCYNIAGESRE